MATALPDQRPTGVRWTIFALCCATSWTLYLHRYAFALMKPKLHEEWGISETALGVMDSAFNLTYSAFQIPGGLLADLISLRVLLPAVIIGWSLCLGLHAVVNSAAAMYWVRLAFGLAQAGCYPALSKVTRAWFPTESRTSMQGWIASFFGRVGGASSNLLFATVLVSWLMVSWRAATAVFTAYGCLLGVVFFILFRNSPARHPSVNEAELRLIEGTDPSVSQSSPKQPGMLGLVRRLSPRSLANLGIFLIQQFTSTFADAMYVSWVPFFLVEEHDLDFGEMGFYSSLPLIGGALGGTFGGYLNDGLIRWTGSRRWGRSSVGFAGKTIACGLIFVALTVYEDPYLFCWILMLVKFFSDWSQPTVWGTITDIGGKATGTVFGIVNMVGGSGALFSPPVFGYIAQHYSWNVVFPVIAAAYLISALCWPLVNCTIPLLAEEQS